MNLDRVLKREQKRFNVGAEVRAVDGTAPTKGNNYVRAV